jgi:hypothetical protein
MDNPCSIWWRKENSQRETTEELRKATTNLPKRPYREIRKTQIHPSTPIKKMAKTEFPKSEVSLKKKRSLAPPPMPTKGMIDLLPKDEKGTDNLTERLPIPRGRMSRKWQSRLERL